MFAHLPAARESEEARACFRRVRRNAWALGVLAAASLGCAASDRPTVKAPTASEPVDTIGQEVAVAAGPDGSIFAAWIGPKGIDVARSIDGVTFDTSVTVSVAGWHACDPAIAVARDGTIEV